MIIQLIDARDKPDREHLRVDDDGYEMQEYCLEYKHRDKIMNTRLWAYSFEDAEAKVCAMRASLELSGQLYAVE